MQPASSITTVRAPPIPVVPDAAGAVFTLPLTRDPTTRAITNITAFDASNPATVQFFPTPEVDGGLIMDFDAAATAPLAPTDLVSVLWTCYRENEIRQWLRSTNETVITVLDDLLPPALAGGSTGGLVFAQGGPQAAGKVVTTDYSNGACGGGRPPSAQFVLRMQQGSRRLCSRRLDTPDAWSPTPHPESVPLHTHSTGQINLWSYTINSTGYYNFTHVRGFDLDAGGGDLLYSDGLMVTLCPKRGHKCTRPWRTTRMPSQLAASHEPSTRAVATLIASDAARHAALMAHHARTHARSTCRRARAPDSTG